MRFFLAFLCLLYPLSAFAVTWPNAASRANSDPWLIEHHDEITQMKPRVMVLNYVNGSTMAEVRKKMEKLSAAFAESSRYKGYRDDSGQPFLQFYLAYVIDMRDRMEKGYGKGNSSLYPREKPQQEAIGLDYGLLFDRTYARHYQQGGKTSLPSLPLCELFERGYVNEVWIYGHPEDNPKFGASKGLEIVSNKVVYNASFEPQHRMDRCAANGCLDKEDMEKITCRNTVRILWIDATRGPGCAMESWGHGFETMARRLPYLAPHFQEFTRQHKGDPNQVAACGNVHFTPNGRKDYDLENRASVTSTCESYGEKNPTPKSWGIGTLPKKNFSTAQDCMGPWLVWWYQNFPGHGNTSLDKQGNPMKNWWPFTYY